MYNLNERKDAKEVILPENQRLCSCVKAGDLEGVINLIDEGATDIDRALILAIEKGHLKVCKILIEAGTTNLDSALSYAVEKRKYAMEEAPDKYDIIIKLLVSEGANIEKVPKNPLNELILGELPVKQRNMVDENIKGILKNMKNIFKNISNKGQTVLDDGSFLKWNSEVNNIYKSICNGYDKGVLKIIDLRKIELALNQVDKHSIVNVFVQINQSKDIPSENKLPVEFIPELVMMVDSFINNNIERDINEAQNAVLKTILININNICRNLYSLSTAIIPNQAVHLKNRLFSCCTF